MKSLFQKIALVGLCSIAPAYLYAADDQTSSSSGQSSQTGMHEHGMMHQHQVSAQAPTDANRASKIVGMEVVNQQNKKLGTVKDLVIDPQSQRVAYAWVKKSDETGNTGKYVAVPLNVFHPTSDQKYLVLNADKQRFDSAQGYADNQFPNMALPPSQISFWQSITEAAGAQSGSQWQQQGSQESGQQQQGGQQEQQGGQQGQQ